MAPDRSQLYWDSCCFLSFLQGDPSRRELQTLMADAQAGGVLIVTSTISVAEVAYLAPEGPGRPLDPGVERQIEGLWRSGRAIRFVEVDAGIAARARTLLRHALAQGWQRNPRDALHLASAQLASVSTVHTYDERWDRYAGVIGRAVERPNLLYVSQAAP